MKNFESAPKCIDPTTYQRISHYAEVVGKPIKQVIDKALNRWMDDFGDVVLESYSELAARHVRKTHTRKKVGNTVVFISKRQQDDLEEIPNLPQAAARS